MAQRTGGLSATNRHPVRRSSQNDLHVRDTPGSLLSLSRAGRRAHIQADVPKRGMAPSPAAGTPPRCSSSGATTRVPTPIAPRLATWKIELAARSRSDGTRWGKMAPSAEVVN